MRVTAPTAIFFLLGIVGLSQIASITQSFGSDFHSARTAALGGSGHAGPLLNDSIYLNPSFSSFLPTYSVGLGYVSYSGPSTEPDGSSFYHGKNVNATIQDGRSEMFQAGFGFTQSDEARYFHVGASKAIVKRAGVGLGGKLIFPFDHDKPQVQDVTLATTVVPIDWFHVVGIVDNLLETNAGKDRGLYREFILGTKFNIMSIVLVYLDPHLAPNAPDSFGYESGLEFPLFTDLFLRMGAFRNSTIPFENQRGNGYGAGVGWLAPRLSLDYGISRVISPQPATAHTFGATVYF